VQDWFCIAEYFFPYPGSGALSDRNWYEYGDSKCFFRRNLSAGLLSVITVCKVCRPKDRAVVGLGEEQPDKDRQKYQAPLPGPGTPCY
jgi:hypothetical protein